MSVREPTEENKKLIRRKRLNPDKWLVVWEDYDTLELLNRRGRRRVIKKDNCQ